MRVFLETERMLLRQFTPADVDLLVELDSDPEVMQHITGGLPTSRTEVETEVLPAFLGYYERAAGYGFWAAIEKSTGDFLGWFHFRPGEGHHADEPELGYRLRRAAWGKGYAVEGSRALIDKGFEEFGVRRVVAETMVVHTASRRVMEKCGLSVARTFHQEWPYRIEGDEHGDVQYALTREEWERQRTAPGRLTPEEPGGTARLQTRETAREQPGDAAREQPAGTAAWRHDADGAEVAVTVAGRMADAAVAWLGSLDADQRAQAHWPGPGADAEPVAERLRWYYTPTDHGGLPVGAMRSGQQSRALQLVASGLSTPGYVTVSTIMGLENVLDHAERWRSDWGRERGRDPQLYYLRVFGEPGGTAPWGWRFGGHHVSLNYLVVDGRVRSTTPCFLGADPASSGLLGPGRLRPLGGTEDLARDLVRSLDPALSARAILLDRAPSDIVGGNRARISDGDRMILLTDVWRGHFAEPRLAEQLAELSAAAERGTAYDAADHAALALTTTPKGVPAAEFDARQRGLLSALLGTYLGRVPDGLATVPGDDAALDVIHLAWAGSTEPGEPHYYRLQGPGLLVEYDNTQRGSNHAHAVWRDPDADFGHDVLRAHRAEPHPG